jgi:hypothetical protein
MLFKMADRNVVTFLDILVALALAAVLLLANGCIALEPPVTPVVQKEGIAASHGVRNIDREGLQAKLVSFAWNTKEARSAHTQPAADTALWNDELAEFDVYTSEIEIELD